MGAPRGWGVPTGAALCCCLLLIPLCAGRPDTPRCKSLDCIIQGRDRCPKDSSKCGPCLEYRKEDSNGNCVKDFEKVQSHSKASPPVRHKGKDSLSEDADIDYLASILKNPPESNNFAEQGNMTPSNPPAPPNPPASGPSARNDSPGSPQTARKPPNDALLLGVVVACAIAGLLALIVAGVCWCRMRKEMKLAEKTDYPAFRQSPPPPYEKTSPGDKKLAQNAQMYHYQHQKQQMISMEKNKDDPKHTDSAVTSDEENEDGDFTVYECPGLAPTGEMEVKNPLFDDSTLHHTAHNSH